MDKSKKVFLLINILLFGLCCILIVLGYLQENKPAFLIGAGVTGLIVFLFIILNIFSIKNWISLNLTYISALFFLCYVINDLYYKNKIIALITISLFGLFLIPAQVRNLLVLRKRVGGT